MESNRLHDLLKMESQSFFSESSVCVRDMRRGEPCTLCHIEENEVQVIVFSLISGYV